MSTPLRQPRNRVPRFAEAAVERARLTVVPRRATVAPRVPFVTLVSVLLVGGIAGLLAFNTNLQQASFVASSMEVRADVLAGKEESLRMQLHRLRDPQHLATRAKRLGMVPSTNPAFLRLEDGTVLGSPAPAEGTDAFRFSPLPPAKPRPELVIVEAPSRGAARAQERRAAAAERREAREATTGPRDTNARSPRASRERRSQGRTNNGNRDDNAGRARGRTR